MHIQILIRLLDVFKNKKGILMDEFDMGLHTRLVDFILDLIHVSESSQLLFTSHNTKNIFSKWARKCGDTKKIANIGKFLM